MYATLFCVLLNRGYYRSAHVLLNLLNEFGKRDKMRGLLTILSLFRNEFNIFNNTKARMLPDFTDFILSQAVNSMHIKCD